MYWSGTGQLPLKRFYVTVIAGLLSGWLLPWWVFNMDEFQACLVKVSGPEGRSSDWLVVLHLEKHISSKSDKTRQEPGKLGLLWLKSGLLGKFKAEMYQHRVLLILLWSLILYEESMTTVVALRRTISQFFQRWLALPCPYYAAVFCQPDVTRVQG